MLGLIPFVRWGVLQFVDDDPGGHLQSLLIGAVLLMACFLSVIIGIISDLIRTNRMLIEDTLEHTKKMRFGVAELPGSFAAVSPSAADPLTPGYTERPGVVDTVVR